jgi:cell wall-associated NlpC family hydrolase
MTVTRQQVVDTAREWIDTPFRHQGRTKAGVDCVGLCVLTAQKLGLSSYDLPAYPDTTHRKIFLKSFDENAVHVPINNAQPGDMVVFVDFVNPCHVGILTERHGQLHVIHAVAKMRKVCETPYAGEWQSRAIAAYAFPGVE